MRRSTRARVLVLAVLAVALTGCVAAANEAANSNGAGFWSGLWQGLISPVMFIVSLFSDKYGIYEIDNNGGWYDFGFMLGVSIVFSGGVGAGTAPARRSRR
jgi:hypothetical protein